MPNEPLIPVFSQLKPSDVRKEANKAKAQQQEVDDVFQRRKNELDQDKAIYNDMEGGKSDRHYNSHVKQSKPKGVLEYKDDLIPISTLFAKPHKAQVKISGNGKYLAWVTRGRSIDDPILDDNGVMNIFCKDLETSQIKQLTFAKERDACSYFIFNADETEILFLREIRRGSETYHLFALEIAPFFKETKKKKKKKQVAANPRNLIKDPRMTCGIGFVGGVQLWTSDETPREVYVSTAEMGPFSLFWDVSRINIDTKECVLVQQNIMSSSASRRRFILKTGLALLCSGCVKPPTAPIQWFPDDDMEFRGCIQIDLVHLGASFCARGKNEQTFKALHSCTFEDFNMELIGSSGGAGTARMDFSSSETDTVDIHVCALTGQLASDTTTYDRFNVSTGEHILRLAGDNEKSDITGFVINQKTKRPQFVTYYSEKPTTEVLSTQGSGENYYTNGHGFEKDENALLADDLEYIGNFFAPSMVYSITSCTSKNDTWVVYAEADRGQQKCKGSPGGYFLFSRSSSSAKTTQGSSLQTERKVELIFPSHPELKGHILGEMKPLRVTASDGEELLCYLSEPPEDELMNPPLIMMVHGGPQNRDTWGFNPLVQLLCNRGFRVLQVNYRGSTGFGSRFIRIGMDGEFCKSLQQDITDVANYAINKGLCAKNRLAIIGGSFGGYSALFGLTFQPDLYKCCVAICPLTAVGAADAQSKKAFSGSPLVKKYHQIVYGKSVSKKKRFAKEASPLYNTDKINKTMASVAIFHGEDDPRAPIGHSRKFVEELKKHDIKGEFVSFAGEGHGISKEENRLFMYNRIEKFLCGQFYLPVSRGEDHRWENNTASVEWSTGGGDD
jgi:pimeloyl-ACP methyl ester carboxylesterase